MLNTTDETPFKMTSCIQLRLCWAFGCIELVVLKLFRLMPIRLQRLAGDVLMDRYGCLNW